MKGKRRRRDDNECQYRIRVFNMLYASLPGAPGWVQLRRSVYAPLGAPPRRPLHKLHKIHAPSETSRSSCIFSYSRISPIFYGIFSRMCVICVICVIS